jgi:hypothetical protein
MGRAFYTMLPVAQKFLLVALCDHANDEGGGVFVGQKRLAIKVGTTDRTVRANLSALRELGYIVRTHKGSGDGRRGIPDHYQIVVGMLPDDAYISSMVAAGTPEESSADVPGTPEDRSRNTGSSAQNTGSVLPPNRQLEPSVEATGLSLSADLFDAFWDVYPRHDGGRGRAFKAWEKAMRKTTGVAIYNGACHYRDDPNREDAFTAHASTWLNQERWDDPPLPSRQKPRRVGQSAELLRRAMGGV